MSKIEDWDTEPVTLEKQPALALGPIPGVLPYEGARNPLTRSNTAHRMIASLATPATAGVPRLYYFDGAREWAAGLEAIMSPELFDLQVQLPFFRYNSPSGARVKNPKHYFDLRVTFKDGFRRAIYVKNGSRLKHRETQQEIDAIEAAMPADFADDMIVVNGDDYTRPYRNNLFRFWMMEGDRDEVADAHVEAVAKSGNYWLLQELIEQCDLPSNRAFPAALRLINRGILGADWYSMIGMQSRVWQA